MGDSFRVGGDEGSLLDLEAALHEDDIYLVDDVPELARDCAALLLAQNDRRREVRMQSGSTQQE